MSGEQSIHDEVDPRFSKRQWIAQRIGWAALLAVILATFAGFFGTSPFASEVATAEQDGARVDVEYPRWSRYQHADRIHVRVHAPGAEGDELRVAFSRDLVENVDISGSTPATDSGGISADGMYYAFQVEDWSQPVSLAFTWERRKSFRVEGDVRVAVGNTTTALLHVRSWVHP